MSLINSEFLYFSSSLQLLKFTRIQSTQQMDIQMEAEKCTCKEFQYIPQGWLQIECPFNIGDINTLRRQECNGVFTKNILAPIFCDCGKQVGEIVFSGKENVGHWRIYQPKPVDITMHNMQEWLKFDFDQQLKTSAHSLIELQQIINRIKDGLGEKDDKA